MRKNFLSLILSCLSLLTAFVQATQFASPEKAVDTIYYGGPIVTLNDKQPSAQAVAVKNGQIVAGNVMKVTLSCDHRVVDGATGAAFLQTLKSLLEEPLRMLV